MTDDVDPIKELRDYHVDRRSRYAVYEPVTTEELLALERLTDLVGWGIFN